jgi:glyoxylase-like metal-dependent hydrolase (beta-lactamase superfamily II)
MVAFDPIRLEARNPGPMSGTGNNTYLLMGGAAAALVDAGVGAADHLAALGDRLRAAGATLGRVLVTHAHPDHASGAAALAAMFPGASFYKYPWPGEDGRYGVDWRRLAAGEDLEAGGVRLTAVHTPGHAPDHLVFWHAPSRTAFTGDLVLPGGHVTIPWSRGGDMRHYLDALTRLQALEPRRLLPAHGGEVIDPAPLIRAHLDHRLRRERQIEDALRAGIGTVQGLVDSIYDGLDPALRQGAAENVRAHLAKLRSEGRAFEDGARWTA